MMAFEMIAVLLIYQNKRCSMQDMCSKAETSHVIILSSYILYLNPKP